MAGRCLSSFVGCYVLFVCVWLLVFDVRCLLCGVCGWLYIVCLRLVVVCRVFYVVGGYVVLVVVVCCVLCVALSVASFVVC